MRRDHEAQEMLENSWKLNCAKLNVKVNELLRSAALLQHAPNEENLSLHEIKDLKQPQINEPETIVNQDEPSKTASLQVCTIFLSYLFFIRIL